MRLNLQETEKDEQQLHVCLLKFLSELTSRKEIGHLICAKLVCRTTCTQVSIWSGIVDVTMHVSQFFFKYCIPQTIPIYWTVGAKTFFAAHRIVDSRI